MTLLQDGRAARAELSRVPYLPGLDGLRALAVVAVMVYHANHEWLGGGFLGVEVFFVISGYLITLLLVGEHDRTGRIELRDFWFRRFRRLLPALYLMLCALAVYMALGIRRPQGQTRGDFLGGIFYISNWYQIFVGQGYTAKEAFVPLRHLWSLAVEEQFYLLWPLIMMWILRRGSARLPRVGIRLFMVSVTIALVTALLFQSGDISNACSPSAMHGYTTVFGRCVSINDTLYLSTITRAGGLMMGAAFAMIWRPVAIMRSPLRDRGRQLDLLAGGCVAVLGVLMWKLWLSDFGHNFGTQFDPWLFRGGFFLTGLATIGIIAAATHQHAMTGPLLGNPVLKWIGTRSYGMYLYHWPIYQIIRRQAGLPLTFGQFVTALAFALPITELSYRFVETPIRKGRLSELLGRGRQVTRGDEVVRRNVIIIIASLVGLVATAAYSFAAADNLCVGDVTCNVAAGHATDTTRPTATTHPTATTLAQTTVPGQTTLPGSTVPGASTSSTIDPASIPPLAVGESVMLGAKTNLETGGFTVDAVENRQGKDVVADLQALRTNGSIGTTVVIQIGTNGTISQSDLDQIMALLPQAQTPNVVFMTVQAPKVPWIAPNNAKITALPTKYPWVKVLDWAAASANTQLCKDGIHVACNGKGPAQYYANLIFDSIGRADLDQPIPTTTVKG